MSKDVCGFKWPSIDWFHICKLPKEHKGKDHLCACGVKGRNDNDS